MIRMVFKSIAIAIFLLVMLVSLLTNKKETKSSSLVTLLMLGVWIWVM